MPPSIRQALVLFFSVCCALLSAGRAVAGADFAAEAERRMRLSFDLDEVEGMLADAPQATTAAALPALPLEPNSQLVSVTVLRDRALVTRVLQARVQMGASSLAFEGLPLGLTPESLYATVRSGDAHISGVELVSGRGEVEESARTQQIREQMLAITEQLGQVRDDIESLLMQRAYLRGALLTPSGDRPLPSLDQVKGTLSFVGDAERRIAAELRRHEQRAAELGEELHPLLVKLANPLATGMTVRVDLDTQTDDDVEVGLRYQVSGARWWPAYNARLDQAEGQVELEYFGVVSQQTGEDWSAVALQLSTANPSATGELPRLGTWYLGRDSYGDDYDVTDNLLGGRGHYEDPGNRREANPAQAAAQGMVDSQMSASVRGTGALVFAIPGKRSVAGDGSQQRLPVGTQTFGAKLELATVPKLVPEVFRQARLRFEGGLPLLPGPVSTYVGSDFVGAGQLDGALPGEDLLLSFGTDERIKVQRQLVSRQQETPSKKTRRWTFHFRIQVSNFGDSAAVVRVADQLPVSEMDKVEVRLKECTPADPPNLEDGPGINKWTLRLAPGQEETIDLRFSVTAPVSAYLGSDMLF